MDSASPSVSFIGIVDFTEDARWLYASESVQDLLGFEPRELIGRPSLDLVHPDEFPQVRAIHYSTITQDQAAVLAYLRMRHKDPCKGYILCAISRTVCQNVLVGSVSFASPGPKAMHNASTAQEVTIITPTAKDFEFRRWGDPSPMPPCPVPAHLMPASGRQSGSPPHNITPMRFAPLPEQSVRTALILNRFSVNCNIQYCSNDSILSSSDCITRCFFDFVAKRDEDLVRSWIDVIKTWGVNERGQPSDGGFGFGKFTLLINGRDSIESSNEFLPPSRRQNSYPNSRRPRSPGQRHGEHARARDHDRGHGYDRHRHWPPSDRLHEEEEQLVVDAIFSAHSDGLMVIIRKSTATSSTPSTLPSTMTLPPPPMTRPSRSSSSQGSSSSGSSFSPYTLSSVRRVGG